MTPYYGWSYADQLKPVRRGQSRNKKIRPQKNQRLVTQHWHHPKLAAAQLPLLNKSGRIVLAVLLVGISLAVITKEPRIRSTVMEKIKPWWAQLTREKQVTKKTAEPKAAAKPVVEAVPEQVTHEMTVPDLPLALIADQGLFMLDCRGQIWPLGHDQPVEIMPIITGVTIKEVPGDMGIRLKSDVDFKLVRKILTKDLAAQLSELHFSKGELIIYTRDGIKVILRPQYRLERDLIRLQAVLQDIRIKNKLIANIDMRYDQHIVVRPISRR